MLTLEKFGIFLCSICIIILPYNRTKENTEIVPKVKLNHSLKLKSYFWQTGCKIERYRLDK